MLKKIGIAAFIFLIAFLGYVSTRDGKFNYERSGVINAPAAKIFPYLSSFKLGAQWNPFAKKDPNMKSAFTGSDGHVGSAMDFEGNREAGSGRLEILNVVPNESVEIRLTMTQPFHAANTVLYRLIPEGAGTKFSWSLSGDGGYMTKLITIFIDCEKMIATDIIAGIQALKSVVEATP